MTQAAHDERIRELMDTFGLSEIEARQALAMEEGRIEGDARFAPPVVEGRRQVHRAKPEVHRRAG